MDWVDWGPGSYRTTVPPQSSQFTHLLILSYYLPESGKGALAWTFGSRKAVQAAGPQGEFQRRWMES